MNVYMSWNKKIIQLKSTVMGSWVICFVENTFLMKYNTSSFMSHDFNSLALDIYESWLEDSFMTVYSWLNMIYSVFTFDIQSNN